MEKTRRRDDSALVRACLKGDPGSWEELILRYRRLIYSIPVSYRLPVPDAEDIFQRVAIKLFENLGGLKRLESLPSWLIVTTRRECQAFLRGARRSTSIDQQTQDSLTEDPPDVAEALFALESEHCLALALERLDEPCRKLLTALYLEEPSPSYKEIAARLDRPVGSLGPTRARCLAKLRKIFDKVGGVPPEHPPGEQASD